MNIRFLALIIFSILLGCSTANKKSNLDFSKFGPPEEANWPINEQFNEDKDFDSIDIYLNRVAKENSQTNTTWWVDYRRAQLWSQKDSNVACENFSRLANEPTFPIRRIAYLRAFEVCPKGNQILSRLEVFNVNSFDPWLSDKALDVAILKAEQRKDRRQLVELYLSKSKSVGRKEEKIYYAERSYKIAELLNDKAKMKDLMKRIYSLSPSRIPVPSYKEFILVANDFRYLREFERSLEYYRKIIHHRKSNINERVQALRGIRTIYKIQQKRDLALAATENLAKYVTRYYETSKRDTHDARIYADTLSLLARTYWTENQYTKAAKTLNDIIQNAANKTSLAEVYWILGRMEEEKQNFSKAVDWFIQALNQTIDSRSFRDRISWYLAWNYRKIDQPEKAIEIFKDLRSRADGNYEKSKLSFWLARALKQAKKNSDAEDELEDLIKQDSLSYYGLLTYRELGRPIPAKILKTEPQIENISDSQLAPELKKLFDPIYYSWLVATHENAIALGYLDSVSGQLKKNSTNDEIVWSQILSLYAKSQNFLGMFSQLNSLNSDLRRNILEKNPRLIFPNPYFDTVNQAAGRFGISPEFIYSIMRQESSFNPQARSPMDAFGLMQLLPQVAMRSAAANSIDYRMPEDLYSPHINIPIGSAHLRELWDKYNGEIILAVASYNASENAILSWLKTRYRGDTLEFIEDIPYDETRDYVKLVLRNLVSYQILSAQEDRFNFPEWTLKISNQDSE